MAIDELQQIAHARATMLMRGFQPLQVEIGPETCRALGHALGGDIGAGDRLLDMRVILRRDMEGFAVMLDLGS